MKNLQVAMFFILVCNSVFASDVVRNISAEKKIESLYGQQFPNDPKNEDKGKRIVIIPSTGITKINNSTYMYTYSDTPIDPEANYFTWNGLNLVDIKKNQMVQCITTSPNPNNLMKYRWDKCSFKDASRYYKSESERTTILLKKILNKQCKLERSEKMLNWNQDIYDCN